MTIRFSTQELRDMAQHDRPGLIAWVKRAIHDSSSAAKMQIIDGDDALLLLPDKEASKRELESLAPCDVARVLRETGLTLSELGASKPEPDGVPTSASFYWGVIERFMKEADPEDGLAIFKTLVNELQHEPLGECASLMHDVLAMDWASLAIEAQPGFFLKQATTLSAGTGRLATAGNAFHVLACMASEVCVLDHAQTLHLIRALKSAGVQDTPSPRAGELSLHMAAFYQGPASFSAFLEEFGAQLESEDHHGSRPLDYAASAEVVTTLLNAGAEVERPAAYFSSPLGHAVKRRRLDNAMILLNTGKCTDDVVERACNETIDAELTDRIRNYHAAVKARQAVDGVGKNKPSVILPL